MYTRSALRSMDTIKQSIRRYATNPPGPAGSAGSNTAIYATLTAAALGGAGYYYYARTSSPPTPASSSERKAPMSSSASASASAAFKGGDQGFIDLKLSSVEEINPNTRKLRFALPNPDDVSGLPVTSAIITKYKGPGMDAPVIRPYTPVSDVDQKGFVDFVIKKYPNGPMSTHLHDMEPNQRLDMKGPIPKYLWTPNKHEHVAMIAGGTGITPMYQLTRAIFKNPTDKTRVTLIFGNLTEPDILLKKEFEELENTYPNRFKAFYLLDKPPEGWTQGSGHVTKELLKTVLPEPKEKDFKIFVCGPPGLYKAVSGPKTSPAEQGELTGMLKDLGYTGEQVYKF